MSNDKIIEKERYDSRAKLFIKQFRDYKFGSLSVPITLRSPYLLYEKKIKELVKSEFKVLEIGSGTGTHTLSLINTGANITATDISLESLKLLKLKIKNYDNSKLKTKIADIESLPFKNESFDIVANAGSLSYGNYKKVDKEIRRVLKPNGLFICIDSLNNNPIYKLNRYIHYLKGFRSKMTLQNMPTMKRLEDLNINYSRFEIEYFGSISFLMPIFSKIIGGKQSLKISDKIDNLFQIKKSAFKFVLVSKA